MNDVYPTADVNYLLWGMLNKLAYDEGIIPTHTNWGSMQATVFMYRGMFGGFISLYQLRDDCLPFFETTSGKMAWARFGWEWVNNEFPSLPRQEAILHAFPNQCLWTKGLHYSAGRDLLFRGPILTGSVS